MKDLQRTAVLFAFGLGIVALSTPQALADGALRTIALEQRKLSPAIVTDALLPKKETEPSLMRAASASIPDYTKLITPANARNFGFDGMPQPKDITPLEPIAEKFVDLATLKTYAGTPLDDAASRLIIPLEKMIVPLGAGGVVRTSLAMANDPSNGWTAVGLNTTPMIGELMAAKQIAMADPRFKSATYSIVSISGLNISFLGIEVALTPVLRPNKPTRPLLRLNMTKRVYLMPTFSSPRLKLVAGVARSAHDVFVDLRADANAHNGKPT